MTDRSPVGVLVHGTTPPAQLREVCAGIEDAGFGELWLSEDYFFLGGPTSAALALAATREIPVGIGILSAVVRHPAVTAMEISTLSLAHPGRLVTGIGHGVPFWTKQMGLYPKSPMRSLRAVIETTRALLAGETLTIDDGPYTFDQISLVHPNPAGVDLYAGVIGPRSLELAGEIADGTVMSVITAPKYLEFAKQHIAAGAAKAGRDAATHKIPTFVLYHTDLDGDRARAAAREALGFYLQSLGPTPMTGVYGINDQLAELLELGDPGTIAAALPEDWVDTFTLSGTPAECIGKIRALLAAGATSVVLVPVPAERADEVLTLTAADVLPHV